MRVFLGMQPCRFQSYKYHSVSVLSGLEQRRLILWPLARLEEPHVERERPVPKPDAGAEGCSVSWRTNESAGVCHGGPSTSSS